MSKPKLQVVVFIGITFLLTYPYEWFFIRPMLEVPRFAPVAVSLIASVMFIPTIGMILTRLILREGFGNLYIKPKIRGNVRFYLCGWLFPVVATLLGAAVYFLVFRSRFDSAATPLRVLLETNGQSGEGAVPLLIIQLAVALVTAPALNAATCLGEEWGWRGYMMPRLNELLGFRRACIIGGIVWGLWHAPLTALGHNYGTDYFGFPYLGVAAMCLFCVSTGTLLSYLSLRVKNCWPAVIGHAMINGYAATGTFFYSPDLAPQPLIGPASVGVLGGSVFILTAVLLLWKGKIPREIEGQQPDVAVSEG